MDKAWVFFGAFILALGYASAGELYKWVDKDGKVHYTDQPPVQDVKAQERKKFGDKPPATQLSYTMQMAVKNFPITLYNADCADACPKATAFLKNRGVPYADKAARDPAVADELKALTGGKLLVPVLKVGKQVITGYEEGAWNNTLDAAGYPKTTVAAARTPATTSKPTQPAPAAKGGAQESQESDDPDDDDEEEEGEGPGK